MNLVRTYCILIFTGNYFIQTLYLTTTWLPSLVLRLTFALLFMAYSSISRIRTDKDVNPPTNIAWKLLVLIPFEVAIYLHARSQAKLFMKFKHVEQ